MSLRAELETWDSALKAYDAEDFEKALDLFNRISDSSKILTNIGLIYATLGEHELAVENFINATQLDQYLAVAYFQCGVSNFLLGRYDVAFKDFEEALLYLRGNQAINYEQLGLQFRLYSAEVLFNKGLCLIYLGNERDGMQDMQEARKEKVTAEHSVIDEAINDGGVGYTVFSIPVGILYRPPENKMKNAKPKDYLGKAKLVAAENANEAYTTFTGVTRMQQGFTPTGAPLEKPPQISTGGASSMAAAASSAPPPPPKVERSGSATARLERSNVPSSFPGGGDLRKSTSIGGRPNAPSAMGNNRGLARAVSARTGGGGSLDRKPSPITQKGGGGPPPPLGAAGAAASRLTEIYDDYLDGYPNPDDMPLPEESKRVAAWASKTQPGAPAGPSRAVSQRIAPSQYGGSSVSRRRPARRPTTQYTKSRYEDEEEGYGSGDYEEGFELVKIKVKLHYNGEVRGMALTPDVPFEEFLDRVGAKFGRNVADLSMKFVEEDGARVSLRDESDYDLAIETARESAKGKPDGKLVVYVDN